MTRAQLRRSIIAASKNQKRVQKRSKIPEPSRGIKIPQTVSGRQLESRAVDQKPLIKLASISGEIAVARPVFYSPTAQTLVSIAREPAVYPPSDKASFLTGEGLDDSSS